MPKDRPTEHERNERCAGLTGPSEDADENGLSSIHPPRTQ